MGSGNEEKDGASARGDFFLTALACVLGLLFAALLFHPLLRGNIYLGSDLGAYHLPVRAFYSHCLKSGQSFLWWPDAFCGYYIHGEGQAGMLHPFHWLIYRFLPLDWAFNMEFASGYFIAYGGMVALLRRWSLPWHAALFGANLFAFSSFTLIHFMHMQAIAIMGHLPWMLLAVDVLLYSSCNRAERRAWIALALLAASQLLLGYPQYVLFTLLALGIYLLVHLRLPGFWRSAMLVALALLTGLLIAGVQVVPTFDVLQSALRQGNGESWRSGSLHPLNLLQWAGPYWFENQMGYGIPAHEYGLYPGVVPLLLSLWLLIQNRNSTVHRRKMRYLRVLAVLALVLALGEYGGLYGLLAKLPVVGAFRCSARHIVLIHFALATLAAMAAARLQEPGEARTARGWEGIAMVAGGWAMIGVVLLLRFFGPTPLHDALTDSAARLVAGPLLVTLVAALISVGSRRSVWALAALITIAALELGAYALPWVWNHAPQSSSLAALETVLQQEVPTGSDETQLREFRAHGSWRVARLTEMGLSNYMGYVGLPPAWVLDPNAASTKRLAGVRWEKQPLHAKEWTVHDDALPRARMVASAITGDPARVLAGPVDLAQVAVTEHAVTLGAGVPGVVNWLHDDPGDVAFETHAESTQLLVFAERFHPGWRVTVDGAAVPLERVNGDFLGCVVTQGAHTVAFCFAPLSLRLGLALSALGLAMLGFGSWCLKRKLAQKA